MWRALRRIAAGQQWLQVCDSAGARSSAAVEGQSYALTQAHFPVPSIALLQGHGF